MKLTAARPIFITLKAPKRLKRRKQELRMRVASSLDARLVVKGKRLRRQRFAVSRKERKVRRARPPRPQDAAAPAHAARRVSAPRFASSRCGAAEPTVSSPACGAASCSYSGASSRSRRSLRFATLDEQSFWYDEAVTVGLVRMDFGDMLDRIPESESTPPLYYIVAWLWAKVFGTGEVGLRSLSALCGTAFVPVVYAIGAAPSASASAWWRPALAAVNPLLVWYSQEARTYALLLLLAGLSFLFFIRLLTGDPRRRTLVLWAVVSALALATHYFAAFLVAIEAVWLLMAAANRRPIAVAVACLAAVELALLPLLLHQRSLNLADFIDEIPLELPARAHAQAVPRRVRRAGGGGQRDRGGRWSCCSRSGSSGRAATTASAARRSWGSRSAGRCWSPRRCWLSWASTTWTRATCSIAWPPLALAVAAGLGARHAGEGRGRSRRSRSSRSARPRSCSWTRVRRSSATTGAGSRTRSTTTIR